MAQVFEAVPVTEKVHWVGAVDWDVRDFHGYLTSRGTSYNAYLVMAEKVTLIDTVKKPFREQLLSRVASVIDPAKVDYVISNHSEMDHSGSLPEVLQAIKPERVFASTLGQKALREHFGLEGIEAVKDGQTLSLGDLDVTFYETRMLHWPDSMFTWVPSQKLLFTNDAFGMHLASTQRFTDELPWDLVETETAKYYANILMPLSKLIEKLLARVGELNLPIEVLATDHGPIWRKDLDKILGLYARWARRPPTNKAVVVYDTMWQSTDKMAQAVAEGLTAGGASAKLMPLSGSHRSDVATEILDAGALLVGSPTLNNNLFPTVADTLTYLKGLKPRNLVGAAFGSYGWSGEVVGQLNEWLQGMGVELVSQGVRTVYVPSNEALAQCRELGRQVAERLRAVAHA